MANNDKQPVLTPTRVEDLRPKVYELPGWDPDEPFYARLKQVSLLNLIERGQLPNELLKIAHKIATSGQQGVFRESTPEELVQFTKLLHDMARVALVEPTYQELEENDVHLTDMQLTAIFQFCQQGVRALEPFRNRPAAPAQAGDDGKGVRESSK